MAETAPESEARGAAETGWLRRSLATAPRPVFVLYAGTAAFATYFCMYAFRKPFAAGTYEGTLAGDLELKTAFAIGQIIGYSLSKLVGIKICSEMTRGRRAVSLVAFILAAELALVLFAVVPPPLKVVAIFLNGLPLGMVWGLVVWYLEGRRTSEILLAVLCCSFIVASGVVKDVGLYLMSAFDVSEWWMPAATGALFLPPFLASVWLLNQVPEPDAADVAARVERKPMSRRERVAFVLRFLPGLVPLLAVYVLLTAYRDFRDFYGVDIFVELGYSEVPAIFSRTEFPVAFGVLLPVALLCLVRNNRLGLLGAHAIMVAGVLLLGVSTPLLDAGAISGLWWMVLAGLGAYLAYVPYNSVLFDRLIAATGVTGTAVFAIYLADTSGYTASIAVQLYKDFSRHGVSRLGFFRGFTHTLSIVGVPLLVASAAYFFWKTRREPTR